MNAGQLISGVRIEAPPIDAAFETLERLRDEGKIRHAGVSNHSLARLDEARCSCPAVATNELPYNLLSRATEAEVLPGCAERAIGAGVDPLHEPERDVAEPQHASAPVVAGELVGRGAARERDELAAHRPQDVRADHVEGLPGVDRPHVVELRHGHGGHVPRRPPRRVLREVEHVREEVLRTVEVDGRAALPDDGRDPLRVLRHEHPAHRALVRRARRGRRDGRSDRLGSGPGSGPGGGRPGEGRAQDEGRFHFAASRSARFFSLSAFVARYRDTDSATSVYAARSVASKAAVSPPCSALARAAASGVE